jgi:hypothetical protein
VPKTLEQVPELCVAAASRGNGSSIRIRATGSRPQPANSNRRTPASVDSKNLLPIAAPPTCPSDIYRNSSFNTSKSARGQAIQGKTGPLLTGDAATVGCYALRAVNIPFEDFAARCRDGAPLHDLESLHLVITTDHVSCDHVKERVTKRIHVLPADKGWEVRTNGKAKATTYRIKRDAEAAARRLAKRGSRGADVIIHGRNGRIQAVDSYGEGEVGREIKDPPRGGRLSRARIRAAVWNGSEALRPR